MVDPGAGTGRRADTPAVRLVRNVLYTWRYTRPLFALMLVA
jgi:hypothetical protein